MSNWARVPSARAGDQEEEEEWREDLSTFEKARLAHTRDTVVGAYLGVRVSERVRELYYLRSVEL